jgi:thiamine biosynthesis protein ThiS
MRRRRDREKMQVTINGQTEEISDELNLSALLKHFSLPQERIAIELNKEVVRKKDWENIKIADGDKLEVIHFVGGG